MLPLAALPRRAALLILAALTLAASTDGGAAQTSTSPTDPTDFGYGPTRNETTNVSVGLFDRMLADFTRERALVPAIGIAGSYLLEDSWVPTMSAAAAGLGTALAGIALTFALSPSNARRFMDDWNRVFTTLTHFLAILGIVALAVTLGALGGLLAAVVVGSAFASYSRGHFLGWLRELGPSTP